MTGVADLVHELRALQQRFELDSAAGARKLPDGAILKLTVWAGDALTIERDDGEIVTVNTTIEGPQ